MNAKQNGEQAHEDQSINLRWEGPFTVEAILNQHIERARPRYHIPGVYLWTEPSQVGNNDYVSYVGKSEQDLWKRQFEHYLCEIGGQYIIPETFRRNKKRWEMDYDCPEVRRVVFSYKEFIGLVEEAFDYVPFLRIYLCPIDAALTANVERNLIWDLQPRDNIRYKKSKPCKQLRLVHHNACWGSESIFQLCKRPLELCNTCDICNDARQASILNGNAPKSIHTEVRHDHSP